jgi:hypothetical protein
VRSSQKAPTAAAPADPVRDEAVLRVSEDCERWSLCCCLLTCCSWFMACQLSGRLLSANADGVGIYTALIAVQRVGVSQQWSTVVVDHRVCQAQKVCKVLFVDVEPSCCLLMWWLC